MIYETSVLFSSTACMKLWTNGKSTLMVHLKQIITKVWVLAQKLTTHFKRVQQSFFKSSINLVKQLNLNYHSLKFEHNEWKMKFTSA